jgi:DNA/RNA endonuclease YhcR with UshA esterase domain
MRLRFLISLLLAALGLPLTAAAAECIPAARAREHIGDTRCVIGKVLQVQQLPSGTTFLNFCDDYRVCPFTVVVFRGDLRQVGDVHQLKGKVIEIHGAIKEYDGRPEIVLRRLNQLRGEAARIPPLPKGYDVEKHGRYSAGKFKHPKSARKPAKKKQSPGVQTEEPEPEAATDQ